MSADLYFTTDSFFFFLSFSFFRHLIFEIAEPKATKIGHMLGSNCNWKRMSKIWGIPSPINRGPKSHLFGPTSQPNGKFNGLYLWKETRYRQSVKCLDNYKGSPTSSQNVINFGPQTASNSTAIFTHPP